MYTNSIYTGTKFLERIQMIAGMKKMANYDDIGLIVGPGKGDPEATVYVYDNELDLICTVTKQEIKTALEQGKID